MGLNWNFLRGGGIKPKNLPWEGYGYYLEQHNLHIRALAWLSYVLTEN